MNPINNYARTVAGLGLLFMASAVNAAWNLDSDASTLSFVSIKKDTVAEVHKFENLSGSVGDNGTVNIEIALASVDTGISIRDERMRKMLFETELFPKAMVSGDIDIENFSQLKPGQLQGEKLELSLSLHGKSKKFAAEVAVAKLEGKRLMVTTVKPIVINAADFELVKGVEALRDVAGLPSISSAVPVTLNLFFEQDK